MNNEMEKTVDEKRLALLDRRRRLLAMPPEKALEAILDSPDAMPLVHSFAEEDLYFLIHDIGIGDALPILSMASESQWEYILDAEGWQRDRISLAATLEWFDLLSSADENRLVQWIQTDKRDLFAFCLFKTIAVRVREHDEDPSRFGNEFITLDGTYYFRFLEPAAPDSADEDSVGERQEIVLALLKKLADADHFQYQKILFEFLNILPAETEEEIYRLRNVRLAEKGFLPFEEAVGIYQPLQGGMPGRMRKEIRDAEDQKASIPLSLYPATIISGDDLFSRAVSRIDFSKQHAELESEFAVLCNTIIAADQKTIRERAELDEIVAKACGYVSIGLQHLSDDTEKPRMETLQRLIFEYPLSSLFKIGYGLVLELKWRADRWLSKSWFQENGLGLGFWGEEWLGVLGGLLLKRPLYYDNFETGSLYREFTSMADIHKTEAVVSDVFRFDTLFSVMRLSVKAVSGFFLTYKNVLLTLWARERLDLGSDLAPIPLDRFRSFFEDIFQAAGQDRPMVGAEEALTERRITDKAKTSFVTWIAQQTGWTDADITDRYGKVFHALFQELESEYGRVAAKNLDPRYIGLLLLEPEADI